VFETLKTNIETNLCSFLSSIHFQDAQRYCPPSIHPSIHCIKETIDRKDYGTSASSSPELGWMDPNQKLFEPSINLLHRFFEQLVFPEPSIA
jgi:hypothetical protein